MYEVGLLEGGVNMFVLVVAVACAPLAPCAKNNAAPCAPVSRAIHRYDQAVCHFLCLSGIS
jgi:hypothetical protein